MWAFGYSGTAIGTAASTSGSAGWARRWAASLRGRSSMLEAYDQISLRGSVAAGGAGPALAAGRTWALGETETTPFQAWYAAQVAVAAERRAGATLAFELKAALGNDDYGAAWTLVHELLERDSGQSAAGFFNALGVETTAQLPNQLVGMTSHGRVHLRGTVGHPANLISQLSRQLAAASHSGALRFSGADVIEADYRSDLMTYPYFTGYRAEYLLVGDGFEPGFLAGAVAAFLPYSGAPVMAQQVLVSDLDGQLPIDPREFLLPRVADAGAGAELVLLLLEAGRLDALLDPWLGYEEAGHGAVAPILEQATVGLAVDDSVTGQYVAGSLISSIGSGGRPMHLDVVAAALVLLLPQLGGVMNGVSGQAWIGVAGGRQVLVSEEDLAAAFRAFADDDAAAAALHEGLLGHYGALLQSSEADPATLNRIAIGLADVSSLLLTSIAEAKMSDARDRDERFAAVIGLLGTLAGLVPLPGAEAAGSRIAASLLATTYNELIDRGQELLETDHEGAARSGADALTAALLFSYTELLTLGSLGVLGAYAVAGSIDEFFVASPHLDRDLYDFSDGNGALLGDLTDRQTQAYGEWITFASADPAINDAISRMLAEFLRGLPHYDD